MTTWGGPPPLSLDAPEAATVQLPSDFASVPYIDEYAGDKTLSSIPNGTARPTFAENIRSGVPNKAWLNHLYKVLTEKDGVFQSTPVTYSRFLSHNQREEDIRQSQDCGGKLLTRSGWDRMFSLAEIFTTGIATYLLAGKHVKRTRYAYQLTLARLHVLKVQAYDHYCRDSYGSHEPMEMWEKWLISNVPTIN